MFIPRSLARRHWLFQSLDRAIDAVAWRWRDLVCAVTPAGLLAPPVRESMGLRHLWRYGTWQSVTETCVVFLAVLVLAAMDVPAGLARNFQFPFPTLDLVDLIFVRIFGLVPLTIIFAGSAVGSHCRFWKNNGRLEELGLTRMDGDDLLPLLWVPPYVRILGLYCVSFAWRVAFGGDWLFLIRNGMGAWFQEQLGPLSLSSALIEFFLIATLSFVAAIAVMRSSLRTKGSSWSASLAFGSCVKYLLYAISGGLLGMIGLAAAACFLGLVASLIPMASCGFFVVGGLLILFLFRQMRLDIAEDYQDCERHWYIWRREIDERSREGK